MKKTLNIFALSAAILAISAALVSCQKENATPENSTPETPAVRVIHVDLAATVAETKATYAEKVVTIQADDQLYVVLTEPDAATWSGATGTLTYDGTSFKGDITYTGTYAGSDIITDAKDLTATFLPKGYGSVGYLSATGEATAVNAFYAGAKSAAVPQLVHLTASITDAAGTPKSPIDLTAHNSVLCYSITANTLTAGAYTVSVSDGSTTISGSVTAVADAVTTFAVAFPASASAKDYTLSIPGYNNVVKSGKTLVAGQVVNIATDVVVNPNAPLPGVFTVQTSPSTITVKFSKGNLQLVGENTWKFADNQWDYFGSSQSDNHRDLFGWGTKDNPNNTSTGGGYSWNEWGENTALVSTLGTGWRTLTSAEWTYLLNSRGGTRYCKATVNSKTGLVIFPDSYSHPAGVAAVVSANTSDAEFTTNSWSGEDWTKMEAAGAVFLPAAGYRSGSSVSNVASLGFYWSSTPYNTSNAYYLRFVSPASYGNRNRGHSVRLVQNQN